MFNKITCYIVLCTLLFLSLFSLSSEIDLSAIKISFEITDPFDNSDEIQSTDSSTITSINSIDDELKESNYSLQDIKSDFNKTADSYIEYTKAFDKTEKLDYQDMNYTYKINNKLIKGESKLKNNGLKPIFYLEQSVTSESKELSNQIAWGDGDKIYYQIGNEIISANYDKEELDTYFFDTNKLESNILSNMYIKYISNGEKIIVMKPNKEKVNEVVQDIIPSNTIVGNDLSTNLNDMKSLDEFQLEYYINNNGIIYKTVSYIISDNFSISLETNLVNIGEKCDITYPTVVSKDSIINTSNLGDNELGINFLDPNDMKELFNSFSEFVGSLKVE